MKRSSSIFSTRWRRQRNEACAYVYNYDAAEPGFLFTNNEGEAADQFARAIKAGMRPLAFINNGETWEER